MAKLGLPSLDSLPCLAPLSAIQVRAFDEVIARAGAVACITHRCDIDYLGDLDDFMKEHDIFRQLTTEEKRFYFSTPDPSSLEAGIYRWKVEACHVLFWSLGHIGSLSYPDTPLDAKKLFHLFFAGGLD